MKKYTSHAQLGDIFELSCITLKSCFTFGFVLFVLLFYFGHIWHVARNSFRDIFPGIGPYLDSQVEFGITISNSINFNFYVLTNNNSLST